MITLNAFLSFKGNIDEICFLEKTSSSYTLFTKARCINISKYFLGRVLISDDKSYILISFPLF